MVTGKRRAVRCRRGRSCHGQIRHVECHATWQWVATHATPMIALRASSIKNPSHMAGACSRWSRNGCRERTRSETETKGGEKISAYAIHASLLMDMQAVWVVVTGRGRCGCNDRLGEGADVLRKCPRRCCRGSSALQNIGLS